MVMNYNQIDKNIHLLITTIKDIQKSNLVKITNDLIGKITFKLYNEHF